MRRMLASLALLLASTLPVMAADPRPEIEAVYRDFADRLNADDVDGLLSLYAEGSVFIPAPGQVLTQREAIRGALEHFVRLSDRFEVSLRAVYPSGDMVLVVADWTLVGKEATGRQLTLGGSTADVLGRDAKGAWRFLIDNPFGTAAPAR